MEYCRLANLPDLNQTDAFVLETLHDWIFNLTQVYGFDGYRVDTIKHVGSPIFLILNCLTKSYNAKLIRMTIDQMGFINISKGALGTIWEISQSG